MQTRKSYWTKERVHEKLDQIKDILANDQTIKNLETALARAEIYKDWFTYVKGKYKDDTDIRDKIKLLKTITEARLLEFGSESWQFIQFILKNNYGYTDKTENTQDTTLKISFLPPPAPSEDSE